MSDRRPGLAFVAVALCALCVALGGCGRTEDKTTTVTTTVDTSEGAVEAAQEKRPRGTIGVRFFGPVTLGMSEKLVQMRFGRPDKVVDVNLGGSPDPPQTNWIWKFDDGTVTLKFDNAKGGLAAYSTTSPQFESAAGVAVGDSIRPVLDERGDELVESPLGTGALVLSEGAPGSSPALTFAMAFDRNEIVEISGGAVVQPAGE